MILKLHTEVILDIAHHLRGYEGNCSRPHGHTSKVEIWVKGNSMDETDLPESGIMFDFGEVKKLKDVLDHRDLNEIDCFKKNNPTAENIVQFIFLFFKNKYNHLQFRIRYYETVVGKETWVECGEFE